MAAVTHVTSLSARAGANAVAMAHFVAHDVQVATLDNVTRASQFSREELFEFGHDAVMEGLKRNLPHP